MPTPRGAPEKSGASAPSRESTSSCADERHEDEDAPEAVDDRRNRREQLGQEGERRLAAARGDLREEDRDAERDGRREEHREKRRIERAPDEGRARRSSPATGSQVLVRQKSRPNFRIESPDSRDSSNAMPATRRTTRKAKNPVPSRTAGRHARAGGRFHRHEPLPFEALQSLILFSASSSWATTSLGSGA